MATTIPFDPSLTLGDIVKPESIDNLIAIAAAQRPVDIAEDTLNYLIKSKQKLRMTFDELANLGLSESQMKPLLDQTDAIDKSLVDAASDYANAVVKSQKDVAAGKAKIATIARMPESPIDWNKSEIKKIELSSNTMNMDVQYVRNENEDDGSAAHAENVAASVSTAISSVFGFKAAAGAANSIAASTLKTTSKHNIEGTLVITAACTHKMVSEFAPFVIDPEKAISAWNQMFPTDAIPSDAKQIATLMQDDGKNTNKITILSGKTVGSSFVGLVHLEKSEDTSSQQNSSASTNSANAQFEYGGWFAKYQGKFGVSKDVSDNVKSMFSNTKVTTHCALITMGLIPSIKSNTVMTSVMTLKPNAQEVMGQLAAIQGATDSNVKTMGSSAADSQAGSQFVELNNSYLNSVVSNLIEGDKEANQVIDTNSLMTAFDDYVQKASKGEEGVPINFFLRELTKPAIAKSWMKKFDPIQNWQFSSGDDNEQGTPKAS